MDQDKYEAALTDAYQSFMGAGLDPDDAKSAALALLSLSKLVSKFGHGVVIIPRSVAAELMSTQRITDTAEAEAEAAIAKASGKLQ